MTMCDEKRYHIEIEPGAVAMFNTPTPDPRTIDILKDVIRLAMEKEAAPKEDPTPTHKPEQP